MALLRQQLTLFVSEKNEVIQNVRARFNPVQFNLIPAHVTLCREDEIRLTDRVKANMKGIRWARPLCLAFGEIIRFADGKGVLMPAKGTNQAFNELRRTVLAGIITQPRNHQPHITLMHPRNATCTDDIFAKLTQYCFPTKLCFDKISLIEEETSGKWKILQEFKITTDRDC